MACTVELRENVVVGYIGEPLPSTPCASVTLVTMPEGWAMGVAKVAQPTCVVAVRVGDGRDVEVDVGEAVGLGVAVGRGVAMAVGCVVGTDGGVVLLIGRVVGRVRGVTLLTGFTVGVASAIGIATVVG